MKETINNKVAVVINRNGMGNGSDELTALLIKNYLTLLRQEERDPAYICLYADGVFLACEGSHVVEELKELEKHGTNIVICKTCLVFNNLLERVAVGNVGTMIDIIDVQHNSTKVITL